MALMSSRAKSNAHEVLSDGRRIYKKWGKRELVLIEVRSMLGDKVSDICSRLSREGYNRSERSITVQLQKLGRSARQDKDKVLVPFGMK
ncbi:MAG: hypothetical protein DRO11_07095 [Methanobacteriota archaeon]|nr:MAG: hypothetical protein DRO11_07095 [Euryarchaeota archaeon]